jgi:hypothetical protein
MTEDGELSSPTSSDVEVFPENFWILFKVIKTLELSMISTSITFFSEFGDRVSVIKSSVLSVVQTYFIFTESATA